MNFLELHRTGGQPQFWGRGNYHSIRIGSNGFTLGIHYRDEKEFNELRKAIIQALKEADKAMKGV